MTNRISSSEKIESASIRGGHFPGILLPPLAVIIIGMLFALITSGVVFKKDVNASSIDKELKYLQSGYSQDGLTRKTSNTQFEYSNQAEVMLSNRFTPEVLFWKERILEWSYLTNMDPNLVATVIQIESCGDPLAESYAGAKGLFQVMPFHFEDEENPFDPDTNALRGLIYLTRSLVAAEGNIDLALAGYNGGISVIGNAASSWADETRRYVYWGSGIFQEAINGSDVNMRLQEWLSHGGASLCKQASQNLGLLP